MKKSGPIEFDKLLVLFNPKSSNAHKAESAAAALAKKYPDQVVIKETPATEEALRKLLSANLKEGDILIPAGGDGTVSTAINCLLHPDMPAALRRTRVLPLGTGRMNDIAHMVNDSHFDDAQYVLKHGRELPIYPMKVSFTPLSKKEKPLERLAVYSLGIGCSAALGELVNDPDFRAKQKARALATREIELFTSSYDVLKKAPYFDVTYKNKHRRVFDINAINGHILAGYYRLPVKLSSKEFLFEFLTTKGLFRTIKTVAELVTNRYQGGEKTESLEFTLHDSIISHISGETFTPPAPCNVLIKLHEEPIIMLATSREA